MATGLNVHIARRYAKALAEIGGETGTLDQIVDEFRRVAAAYDDSGELRAALENPLVPHASKKAIVADIADRLALSPVVRNTLLLLVDRRRMRILSSLAQVLKEMNDSKKGLLRAEVISAAPLSDGYYQKLHAQLEKMTGKKIALDKKTDPTLLAGVVTRIGDTVYDGSLLSRLREMRAALAN
jgi:F-type H+-transporting ATPase subunit delta